MNDARANREMPSRTRKLGILRGRKRMVGPAVAPPGSEGHGRGGQRQLPSLGKGSVLRRRAAFSETRVTRQESR